MKDDTYNGWTNYETWNWKLWLDNDQGTQEYWEERVQAILDEDVTPRYDWETREQLHRRMLAEELEQDCEDRLEQLTEYQAGPFIDMLNGAVNAINWNEIAGSLLDN